MISTKLMIFLMAQYALIAIMGACEGNWNRCLYFFGALLISLAVINLR